jgi:hypothetical protein
VILIPAILAWLGALLTLTTGLGCHMIDSRLSSNHNATLGFGPWTVQIWNADGIYVNTGALDDAVNFTDDIFLDADDQAIEIVRQTICVSYSNWYLGIDLRNELGFDGKVKTAQSFSMMAMILALLLLIGASLPCCCAIGQRAFVYFGFASVFTAFASLMTLIMADSSLCNKELGCSYGWTAWFCVSAGVVWLATGISFMKVSGKEARNRPTSFVQPVTTPSYESYPVAEVAATGQLETTQETTRLPNADGTVTVVNRSIVHNSDGSKTVTEASHIENWQ